MQNKTRIRVAAAVTALFVGGLAAVGLASRDATPNEDVAVVEAAAKDTQPKVVHRRKVRTVHAKAQQAAGGTGATGSGAGTAVVAPASAPAVVTAPASPQPASAPADDSGYADDEDSGYADDDGDEAEDHSSEYEDEGDDGGEYEDD